MDARVFFTFFFSFYCVGCVFGWAFFSQVMTGLGYPFDRQTLFAVSMQYKNFLYGYEQVDQRNQRKPASYLTSIYSVLVCNSVYVFY